MPVSAIAASCDSGSRRRVAPHRLGGLGRLRAAIVGDEDEPAGAVLLDPAQEGVAHDAEQPDPDVRAAKRIEIAERAQIGVLQHVLGVGRVAREPAREIVGRVEMRQRQKLEAAVVGRPARPGILVARSTSLDLAARAVLFPARKRIRRREFRGGGRGLVGCTGPAVGPATETIDMSSEMIDGDGIDRRGFLRCMAWAGTAVVWTVAGGVPRSGLIGERRGGRRGGFSFVQISDSHIGFNKAGQPGRGRHLAGGDRADQRGMPSGRLS